MTGPKNRLFRMFGDNSEKAYYISESLHRTMRPCPSTLGAPAARAYFQLPLPNEVDPGFRTGG